MKYFTFLLAPILCFSQTIWNGPLMTFEKENFDNPSDIDSQDRITDLVWLTRGGDNVLFNAKTQSSAPINGYASPEDTRWAEGDTNNLTALEFSDFKSAAPKSNNGTPRVKNMVGRNYVVHLITDNIYIDLKMLSWQQGAANGGGFSYERSTDPSLSFDTTYKKSLYIYPNPTDGLISFNTNIVSQIKVYNIKGKMIKNSFGSDVDLTNIKGGLYLIKFFRTDTNEWETKRVIKGL